MIYFFNLSLRAKHSAAIAERSNLSHKSKRGTTPREDDLIPMKINITKKDRLVLRNSAYLIKSR